MALATGAERTSDEMKKLAMLMVVAFAVAVPLAADTEKVGDYTWIYRIEGDTAEICNNASAAISPSPTGAVTIPATLGGKPVTSIGGRAFSGCSGLTSVTIGKGVTSIGSSALSCCSGLTSVTIPDSVTSIGGWAFSECSGLTSVTIGKGVTSIGAYAFSGCSGLTSVTIPDSVTSIEASAFTGCSGLTSVTLAAGVLEVGYGAFEGCTNITSLTAPFVFVPWGVVKDKLTSVTIPNGVTSIGNNAFSGCSGLTSVKIPDSVTSIGQGAFKGCSSLTNVTYLGDAPDTGLDIYYGTPRTLVSYVKRGSIGWAGGVSKILPKLWNEREIAYGRASSFGPSEFEEPESVLWADTPEGEVPSEASTYDGYLCRDGAIAGTIQVKVGKPNANTLLASVKATVIGLDGKRKNLKAADKGKAPIAADGPTSISLVGGEPCTVTLGARGMSGTYGAYSIDGGLNVFASKDAADKAVAAAALGAWQGAVNVAWEGAQGWNGLSVAIAAKGKAKASGTLADGTKTSASSQLIVGEDWCCVPVLEPKKSHLAFTLWLPRSPGATDGTSVVPVNGRDARSPSVVGLADAVVGRPGTLKAGATFRLDAALGDARYAAYLPDGVPVAGGAKWTVPKAGKVQLTREGTVDEAKLLDNPSALKLTYTAKTGTFKGSFKAYADANGKPKATTASVTGVLVDGVGYGAATVRKPAIAVPVTIE